MKIYTISYQDADDNTIVEWLGTQADFNKRKKALKKEGFVPKDKIVDFPLDKTNVIGFLNHYATTNVDGLIDLLPVYKSKVAGEAEEVETEAA
jgi:hypothetical protein